MTINLDELERLAKAATHDNWVVQSTYGGERLMDENSDTPFSCVLPENGSWPEDTICEVWGTEHDDEANAAFIVAAQPTAILKLCAEVRRLREALNTPQLTRCELGSGGWSADGAHHDAAETAFMSYHASVVTVYYGTKRVFAHMAEFDSVHPTVKP